MKAWLKAMISGGFLLVPVGLVGCGPSLPGEDGTPGALKQSDAALAQLCPAQPLAAGDPSATQCGTYYCGDGLCRTGETQYNCPDDCGYPSSCGDGVCSAAAGENDSTCPSDCYCGDNICNGSDTVNSCPRDCGCPSQCGNGVCNNNESTASCWVDCGTQCGDGACNGGENSSNCAQDCGSYYCGDGYCRAPETRYNCPSDCGGGSCLMHADANSMLPPCPLAPETTE